MRDSPLVICAHHAPWAICPVFLGTFLELCSCFSRMSNAVTAQSWRLLSMFNSPAHWSEAHAARSRNKRGIQASCVCSFLSLVVTPLCILSCSEITTTQREFAPSYDHAAIARLLRFAAGPRLHAPSSVTQPRCILNLLGCITPAHAQGHFWYA